MYCQSLADEVHNRQEASAALRAQSAQTPLSSSEIDHLHIEHMELLDHLHASNCGYLSRQVNHISDDATDPRTAALMFMVAATPSNKLADDLSTKFDTYRSRVGVTPSHSLQEHGPRYLLHNIPDTVNPVKAHLAYIQVPMGDTTDLKLVWKVCYLQFSTSAVHHIIHKNSYKWKWRIIGTMRPLMYTSLPKSFPSSTGLPTPL